MERNPALHITFTDLQKVFEAVGISVDTKKVLEIFKEAKRFQIRNRSQIVAATAKSAKNMKRAVETDAPDVELFNRQLTAIRQQEGHKHIMAIHRSDAAYPMLKEISVIAVEFSELFKITPKSEGMKRFIILGMGMMSRQYALNKFKFYKEKIFKQYESYLEIENDDNKKETAEFCACWMGVMEKETGVQKIITGTMDYVHMVFGRQEADKQEADYSHWVLAQIEGLRFLNVIPELNQLYGENAVKRWERYTNAPEAKKSEDGLPEVFEDEASKTYYENLRRLASKK